MKATRVTSMICNSSGQSLVQVLVAAAISTIVMMATMTTIYMQNKEAQALQERLGRSDLQNFLEATLSDGSVCSYMMTTAGPFNFNVAPQTFDSSQIGTTTPPTVKLNAVLASASSTAPSLAEIGTASSPLTSNLVPGKIEINSIQSNGTPTEYIAALQVTFDAARLVRSLRPASVQLTLHTSGAGNIKTITGCQSSAAQCWKLVGTATGTDLYETCAQHVGIGTAKPTQTLHVAGSEQVDDTLYVTNAIGINTTANTTKAAIEIQADVAKNGGAGMVLIRDGNVKTGFNVSGDVAGNGFGQIGTISAHGFQLYTTNIPRLTIGPAGNASFGGDVALNGTLKTQGGCNGCGNQASDLRLKENVQPLEDSLVKIRRLQGIRFEYSDVAYGKGPKLGLIAQDVIKDFPEVVSKMSNGFYMVDYPSLVAPLIESVKILADKNADLEARLLRLEKQTR